MVSDFRDRAGIEEFLRNASAEELLAERSHIQSLLGGPRVQAAEVEALAARIAYELRFRVAQAI